MRHSGEFQYRTINVQMNTKKYKKKYKEKYREKYREKYISLIEIL